MPSLVQRTVLFVDLRGSTGLFETLGNAQAASVVTHSVSLMAQIVKSCGGTVVKTLGDGLMAVFERPPGGIEAADEMHESLDRVVSDAPRRRYGATAVPDTVAIDTVAMDIVSMYCFSYER